MAKFDIAQAVTDQIIEKLEAGVVPWHKPWDANRVGSSLPRSLASGKMYRGVNILLLDMVSTANGYSSPWWGTYDQIAKRGGQVRKGEKGTLVVFWKMFKNTDKETGEEKSVPVLRFFKVFNLDQADGEIKARTLPEPPAEFEAVAECEQAIKGYYSAPGAPSLAYGGDRACYSPSRDHVQMPERESFDSPAHYYGTLFHETVHSTGHSTRLARPDLLEFHHFGDRSYTREELTAELGAAFLSAFTGVGADTVNNSASYLASWVSKLKDDPKAIVVAAGRAHKAVELILGAEDVPEDDATEE